MTSSNGQKIKKALQLKETGNDFFKAKNYTKAARHYLEALLFVKGMVDSSNEYLNMAPEGTEVLERSDAEEVAVIHLSCLSNLSTCHFKRGKFNKCLEKCEEGFKLLAKKDQFLQKENHAKFNCKFYHRKILCLVELSLFERATKTLNEALKKYPKNRLVRSTHAIVKENKYLWLKEQKKKQKALFSEKLF